MANRQALRDLQTRLAGRLAQARTEGVASSWLAVEAGGQPYLLPLAQAGEIFPWGTVQTVPYTSTWFLGVANLRGGLYGVVDLSSFLTGQKPVARTENVRDQSRLVAFNPVLEVNCALLIDRLSGLRSAQDFATSHAAADDAQAWYSTAYVDHAGKRWQELNLQALAGGREFLAIGA